MNFLTAHRCTGLSTAIPQHGRTTGKLLMPSSNIQQAGTAPVATHSLMAKSCKHQVLDMDMTDHRWSVRSGWFRNTSQINLKSCAGTTQNTPVPKQCRSYIGQPTPISYTGTCPLKGQHQVLHESATAACIFRHAHPFPMLYGRIATRREIPITRTSGCAPADLSLGWAHT